MRTEIELRKLYAELIARESSMFPPTDERYDVVESADLEARICLLEWILED